MYYNDYNLQQLLELALRVPEIGAVNFNILYYILKTIIQNQGLEAVKPVFSLDAPLNAQSDSTKTKLKEVTLKKSFSAESLKKIDTNEDKKEKPHEEHREKESTKWNVIKISKRINAIDDEISEMNTRVAELIEKEKNFGSFEKKFMKEVADVRQSVKVKLETLEDLVLFSDEKLLEMDSKISMLMSKKHKCEESSDDHDKDCQLKKLEEEITDISLKFVRMDGEIILIKRQLQSAIWDQPEREIKYEKIVDEDAIQKSDVVEIDKQLVNVSVELHKVLDRTFVIEQSCKKYDNEFELLKDSCYELVHSVEGLKENVVYRESEVTVLTELPGMKNRIEQLEEYVYSGSEIKGTLQDMGEDGKKFDYKESTKEGAEEMDDSYDAKRKFQTVLRDIALTQDMKKKKAPPKTKAEDLYGTFEEEEDHIEDEEPEIEKTEDDNVGEVDESPSLSEISKEQSDEKVESVAYAAPGMLEEYSHQIRGQVIVFVKKRLHDIEIDLHNFEGTLSSMKEKMDKIEKYSKDLGDKLAFMDTNFHQRAGDLATLKEMAETQQVSIVNLMHHLDRKAEAYAVNQKISRKEITVIEDRFLKLCMTSTSEISKLEEKIDSSIESFNIELDKKLFLEEFKLQYDFLLHKLKVIENNVKDFSSAPPVFDLEGIRPIEIKKYVLSKNGMKQEQRKIVGWGAESTSESVIPLLSQSLPDRQVSPKTAKQIQKTLELTAYRDCKRFVEGAYTKVKVGKK